MMDLITAERGALADVLAGLSPAQWQAGALNVSNHGLLQAGDITPGKLSRDAGRAASIRCRARVYEYAAMRKRDGRTVFRTILCRANLRS